MSIKKTWIVAAMSATLLLALIATMSGCAPEASSGSSESSESSSDLASTVKWSSSSDCVACHAVERDSKGNEVCGASKHVDQSCMSCHIDETTLADVHAESPASAKPPKRLKTTSVDEAVCESCHGPLEKMAPLTANSTVLTDKNGKTVNPHALPNTSEHSDIVCADCHQMHADQPLEVTAMEECMSCHHAEIFECGTCHS